MTRRVSIRLSALPDDVEALMILFRKMEERAMISIIQESNDYQNDNKPGRRKNISSKLVRRYVDIDLLLPINPSE